MSAPSLPYFLSPHAASSPRRPFLPPYPWRPLPSPRPSFSSPASTLRPAAAGPPRSTSPTAHSSSLPCSVPCAERRRGRHRACFLASVELCASRPGTTSHGSWRARHRREPPRACAAARRRARRPRRQRRRAAKLHRGHPSLPLLAHGHGPRRRCGLARQRLPAARWAGAWAQPTAAERGGVAAMAWRLELARAGRSSPAPGGALRRVEGSELALLSLKGGGDLRCSERDDAFLRLVSAVPKMGPWFG